MAALPPDVVALLERMVLHIFAEVEAMVRREVPKQFGQLFRGGKVDGAHVTIAIPATTALPATAQNRLGAVYPDGTTILMTAGGEIAAAGTSSTGCITGAEISSYQVQEFDDPANPDAPHVVLTAGSAGVGANILASTTYYYGVTVQDCSGFSTTLIWLYAFAQGVTPTKVVLNWDAPAGAVSYQVYRRTTNVPATAHYMLSLGNVTTWTDDGSLPEQAGTPPLINGTGNIIAGRTVQTPFVDFLPDHRRLTRGSGAPPAGLMPDGYPAAVGDIWWRTDRSDHPLGNIYQCTVGGATPTWMSGGYLDLIALAASSQVQAPFFLGGGLAGGWAHTAVNYACTFADMNVLCTANNLTITLPTSGNFIRIKNAAGVTGTQVQLPAGGGTSIDGNAVPWGPAALNVGYGTLGFFVIGGGATPLWWTCP